MKRITLRLLLLFLFFASVSHAADLSPREIVSLIHPLEKYAMQYGEGDIKAYVFVDPKCPHSRDFISMIHDNEKMRSIYHWRIRILKEYP